MKRATIRFSLELCVSYPDYLDDDWVSNQLLDWKRGELWPLPAAILPACIPLARSLVEMRKSPGRAEALIVAGLLLAIGGLQLYGQQRNKRERTEAEIRFTDLITENRKQSILIIALIDQFRKHGVELRRIADGIAAAICQVIDSQLCYAKVA